MVAQACRPVHREQRAWAATRRSGELRRPRSEDSNKASAATDIRPLPSIDPLRLIWVLTTLALAIVLAYLHVFPQGAYPLNGLAPSVGLIILLVAAALVVARSPWLTARTFAPLLLPCVLVLWAWWRTSRALVPSEGIPLLGTLLEGCLIFPIALILAATSRGVDSFSIYEPATAGESEGRNSSARRPRNDTGPAHHSLFLTSTIAFFLILAAALALWALYEYSIRYDQQLYDLQQELKARGRSFANLTSQEWALLDALRAKRVSSRFGNPNALAGFLSMVVPLAIAGAVIWRDRLAKAAALIVLGLIWYVVLLSASRGGMLTVLFATVVGALVLGRETIRKQWPVLAIVAGLCVASVVVAFATHDHALPSPANQSTETLPRARYSFFERFWSSPGVAQRLYYLQSGWAMLGGQPWWGRGLGSYAILYPKYKQPLARETRYPHNIALHLWIELGLVGLFLWVGWIAEVFTGGIRWWRRLGPGLPKTAMAVFLVAAAAFVLNNLFEITWTFRETYLDWCLLMGIMAGAGVAAGPTSESATRRSGKAAPAQTHAGSPPPPRPPFGPLAIVAVPLVLGVVLVNPVLLRPMLADAAETSAKELLEYGVGPNAEAHAYRQALKAIRYQPQNARYHQWLACYYRDRGRPAEAREAFQKAVVLNPYSAAIRADFALLEQKNNRPDEARRLLTEAIELYPNARYYQLLADLERSVGNVAAARRQYEAALKCVLDNRESASIRADFADFERKNNRPDEARRLLTEAVNIYPPNSRCHFMLAEIERDAGNFAAAKQQIDEALKYAEGPEEKAKYEQLRRELEEKARPAR